MPHGSLRRLLEVLLVAALAAVPWTVPRRGPGDEVWLLVLAGGALAALAWTSRSRIALALRRHRRFLISRITVASAVSALGALVIWGNLLMGPDDWDTAVLLATVALGIASWSVALFDACDEAWPPKPYTIVVRPQGSRCHAQRAG